MGMAEALKGLIGKVEWLKPHEAAQQNTDSAEDSVLKEMSLLVNMAANKGYLDTQSTTWAAVSSWAATELMHAMMRGETADDAEAATLRARCKAMRDVLALADAPRAPIRFEDTAPIIP